jgi:hypothetical protein
VAPQRCGNAANMPVQLLQPKLILGSFSWLPTPDDGEAVCDHQEQHHLQRHGSGQHGVFQKECLRRARTLAAGWDRTGTGSMPLRVMHTLTSAPDALATTMDGTE